jgi:tRNA(Ile)-lysidine synthase
MISDFAKYISEHNLVKPSDKVLLAVSGGIDSMVMANLFHLLNYKTGIAHCNFALRGEDSDKDEELVRSLADENKIPFYTVRFDTKEYARSHKLSIQMAARELRYEWFETIRSENGYQCIAIAHNLNDNIETLLINLTRGTGLMGMTGIKPVSGAIIRPMMFATRKEIVEFQEKYNIIYREDKSNTDTKYVRNKIRHKVIPVLKEINPAIEQTLSETADRFTHIHELVKQFIDALRTEILSEKENIICIRLDLRPSLLKNKAILFELFKPYGITDSLLADLISIIEGESGGTVITGTHRIIKNRNTLLISDSAKLSENEYYVVNNLDEFGKVPVISSAEIINVAENFKIPADSNIACIDLNSISFPLTFRRWKNGDSFFPLGMKQRKKLSDYFIDRKYSLIEKENVFILECSNMIVWIIGERLDNRFRITEETTNALKLVAT